MPTVKIEDISTVKNEIYYLLIKWNLFRMLRWNIYSYFKNEIYSSSKKEKYSYTIKIPTISVKKSANHSNWVPTVVSWKSNSFMIIQNLYCQSINLR